MSSFGDATCTGITLYLVMSSIACLLALALIVSSGMNVYSFKKIIASEGAIAQSAIVNLALYTLVLMVGFVQLLLSVASVSLAVQSLCIRKKKPLRLSAYVKYISSDSEKALLEGFKETCKDRGDCSEAIIKLNEIQPKT